MRQARTQDVIQAEEKMIEEIQRGGPCVVLQNLSFADGVTVEYPEDHSLVVSNCDFDCSDGEVVIKVVPRTATPAQVEEVTTRLQAIEQDLET